MKRLLLILLIAALLTSFAACGDDHSDSEEDSGPENDLIGCWETEIAGVTYHYEFSDDNTLDAYIGSIQIKADYVAEQKDGYTTLEIPVPSDNLGAVGALDPSKTGEFTVTDGTYDDHNRTAELKYDDDQVYTFTEVGSVSPEEVPPQKNFKEDPQLTGSWINNYSNEQGSQHLSVNDDGTLIVVEAYDNNGVRLNIIRNCTYTTDQKGSITVSYIMGDTNTASAEYKVTDNSLELEGALYTREGTVSELPTATETAAVETTDPGKS